jgi:hypothetical protein
MRSPPVKLLQVESKAGIRSNGSGVKGAISWKFGGAKKLGAAWRGESQGPGLVCYGKGRIGMGMDGLAYGPTWANMAMMGRVSIGES